MESTFVVTASTAMPYQCTSELWFELEIYELVKARPPTSRDNQTTMYDLAVELRLQFVATKEGKAKMPTTAGDPVRSAAIVIANHDPALRKQRAPLTPNIHEMQ